MDRDLFLPVTAWLKHKAVLEAWKKVWLELVKRTKTENDLRNDVVRTRSNRRKLTDPQDNAYGGLCSQLISLKNALTDLCNQDPPRFRYTARTSSGFVFKTTLGQGSNLNVELDHASVRLHHPSVFRNQDLRVSMTWAGPYGC
jgi:hypothetical protein